MRKAVFAALVLCGISLGCAATIKDLSRTQYLHEAFSAAELQAGGLAILPITAGQGQEGYRRPLGDFINANVAQAVPGGKTLQWQAAMDSLNAHGKVSVYEDMIQAYRQTSIVNRERVKEMRDALGVRYALYSILQDYSETQKTSFNIFSGWDTKKTANVSAHCLVLDLATGDVVQEIVGQAQSVAGDLSYNSPYEAYAAMIAHSVLAKLPGSQVAPKPPDVKKSSSGVAK